MKQTTQPYYGDLEKTRILEDLCKTPYDNRDPYWEEKFLAVVAEASFACGNPQVIQGPDGYPYFQLNFPEPGKEFECFVIKHMKDDFLLEQGLGVVINAAKDQPDWVFPYGDIVNLHLKNEFYTDAPQMNLKSREVISESEEVLVGQPSEEMLPDETRAVLRNFFAQNKIKDVKLLLMQRGSGRDVTQDLVFNITPEQFQNEDQYDQLMKGIGWFLPRHYIVSAMAEESLNDYFEDV